MDGVFLAGVYERPRQAAETDQPEINSWGAPKNWRFRLLIFLPIVAGRG
jgi:hypothetical protein